MQTRADELANLAGVKATLAENVVLVCFNWLWQDALNNRLPVCIMPHVALDTAEFPSTRPLLDRIRNFGNYMDKMNLVDEMVLKKVQWTRSGWLRYFFGWTKGVGLGETNTNKQQENGRLYEFYLPRSCTTVRKSFEKL